jgi:hypothetical protein
MLPFEEGHFMLGTITLRLYINWGILVLHGESATSITNTQKLLNCHTTPCCRELVVGVENDLQM